MDIETLIEQLEEQLQTYEDKSDDMEKSIENDFNPGETPIDIDEAEEYADEVVSLVSNLRQLADMLDKKYGGLTDEVARYASWWRENPDAEVLPPFPPKNDPSKYDSDLFGNESD